MIMTRQLVRHTTGTPPRLRWGGEDRDGVRTTRVWRRPLGIEHTVIEWVDLESGPAEIRVKAAISRS
jgi:hypothetical protein